MLQYLRRTEISAEKWDACVAASRERIIYAHSWYLDTVCPNWEAIVEIAESRYVSVFPLPCKSTLGIRHIYQPFFTQQLGLFTGSESHHTDVEEYVSCIPDSFKRIYLQLNTANGWPATVSKQGFSSRARTTYHLDLSRAYDQIAATYSTNLKRNLKKAKSYTVVSAANLIPLIGLFRQTKGKEVAALKEKNYAILRLLFEQGKALHEAQLLEVREQGALLAGALFLCSPGQSIFLFGASSTKGKETGAMALLLDHLIREQADRGGILDFEGSDLPGVAKFYAGFGAQPVMYVSLAKTNYPLFLR